MPRFINRIGLSLLMILAGAYLWEFHVKPVSGPDYTAAVNEYRDRNYEKSLSLLQRAYEFDPNNTSVLTLMGWDYLKTGRAELALEKFRRAHHLAPDSPDTILGYADTEISLRHYQYASKQCAAPQSLLIRSARMEIVSSNLPKIPGARSI